LARLSLEGHLLIPGRGEGADSCSNEWPSV
jgi:hypothetical protein